jgi:CheY-specific phosphatase CheX
MYVGVDEVRQITESIWQTVLGWEIGPAARGATAHRETTVTGCVPITGNWSGAVKLCCDESLARDAAAAMFAAPASMITAELLYDALGELTNMTGGNLKALLPEPCYLGLPTVAAGSDADLRLLDSSPIVEMGFVCQGRRLTVTVLRHEPAPCTGKAVQAALSNA